MSRGFSWANIDSGWEEWTPVQFRDTLHHDPGVLEGFLYDMKALRASEALVMAQPAGRSSALELGWAAGAGKPTIVLLGPGQAELMLKMADYFCLTIGEVVDVLEKIQLSASPT